MHRRRRTALTVSAALLVAAPLLAACGSEAHPGAAAVVGGQRIEVSTVQAKVADVRAAQERSPQAAQLIKDSGRLGRAKLYDLIVDQVVQKAADDAGVKVSRKDIQDGRAALAQQSGGEDQLAAMYLQQRGVAPDQLDDVVRRDVLVAKLATALGATNSPEGQQKLNEAFTAAARSLDIDVNPRFGTWDDQKLELGSYKAPWITQVTKEQEPVEAGA
ncbi:SurA N-terminal domain-containing protein [Streptomyces sp. NBC_01142]|uniref:SurA N-terminal domain-containing protein n=1 Tax=Streptomyces sp. NBC_01142 TaxID=2975865 RepID=UPI00225325D3|nr:SurA N-terminal domain-containing protein [Streptomyces sp. NBC_01142]MCX4823633.1 SurA N-terminal domain-containing protein [Streptomyces sp. NBC_01142]